MQLLEEARQEATAAITAQLLASGALCGIDPDDLIAAKIQEEDDEIEQALNHPDIDV